MIVLVERYTKTGIEQCVEFVFDAAQKPMRETPISKL